MTIFADDATLVAGTSVLSGKGALPSSFAGAPILKPDNTWVALTRAQNFQIDVQGDEGYLLLRMPLLRSGLGLVCLPTRSDYFRCQVRRHLAHQGVADHPHKPVDLTARNRPEHEGSC